MTHVVCVGDLMLDVVARLPGPLAPGSDTPAVVSLTGGGAAANVAAWLVTAGVDATFVGRVGDDDLGRRAVAELRAGGVRTATATDAARPTGTCIVLVDPDGERTMVPSAGANAGLGELDAAATLPARADVLYLSGYALLDAGARPFARAALTIARERGWSIAVDAASSAPLSGLAAGEFAGWLGRGLLLLANTDEAGVLAGPVESPVRALGRQFGEALVKAGADGAAWSDGDQEIAAAAVRTRVVDTTGAGDAFTAGFLAARLAGGDVAAALAAGVELGAAAVGRLGARPITADRV